MPLSLDQLRFLRLHQRYVVTCHKWLFLNSTLHAATAKGQVATLNAVELDELLASGLFERGLGCADVVLTSKGQET